MFDTSFMTYKQLIERLRVDLNSPTFFGFDLSVPNNETEYLKQLAEIKDVILRSRRQRNVR